MRSRIKEDIGANKQRLFENIFCIGGHKQRVHESTFTKSRIKGDAGAHKQRIHESVFSVRRIKYMMRIDSTGKRRMIMVMARGGMRSILASIWNVISRDWSHIGSRMKMTTEVHVHGCSLRKDRLLKEQGTPVAS